MILNQNFNKILRPKTIFFPISQKDAIKIAGMVKKIILSLISLCMLINSSLAASCPDIPDSILSSRPALEDTKNHIDTEAQIEINKDPQEVSVWFDNMAPETIIRGTDRVSGVHSTCLLSRKAWGEIGSRRLVFKNSGSHFVEEVLENQSKKYFHYVMWDFSKDVTHAIKYADASFEVVKIGPKKSILKWHVAFRPSNIFCNFPISIYVKTSFAPFMEQSLIDIKNYIETH